MALTTCRECGKHVSADAKMCPHCGVPHPNGFGKDWKSKATLWGLPLVHIAYGRDRQGKRRVATGIIAIGQYAMGVITIAQFGIGLITIAQFGIGTLFGFGQFILGLTAVAQFAGAVIFGLGQFASGYVAIGQLVLANYGLAQGGMAHYLWSVDRKDMEAVEFFQQFGGRAWVLVVFFLLAAAYLFHFVRQRSREEG